MARETYNYCDCRSSKNKIDLRLANDGRLKMSPTSVDSKGICVHCGYNALISAKPLVIVYVAAKYRDKVVRPNGVRKYLRD